MNFFFNFNFIFCSTVLTLFEQWLAVDGNEAKVEHFLTLPFQRAVFKAFLPQKNSTLLAKAFR